MLARLLALMLLLPLGAACAEEAADEETEDMAAGEMLDASGPLLSYVCESGAELQLAEVTLETGETLVFLFFDGDEIQMQPVPAPSGVKYRSPDPDTPLVWHAKGDEGFLAREEAGGENDMLETGCRLQ